MKKQKVFVLVQHGNDNQDNSNADVIGVYRTKRPQPRNEWQLRRLIL